MAGRSGYASQVDSVRVPPLCKKIVPQQLPVTTRPLAVRSLVLRKDKGIMVSALVVGTVVALLGLHQPGVARDRDKVVLRDLTARYERIVAGFKKDDPSEWLSQLTPDFTLTLFNGAVQDRQWVVDYVTNNAKNFHLEKLSMKIKGIEVSAGQVVARVEQISTRTSHDESGALRRLDVGAIQLETWVKTEAGWRLKHVKEHEVLYVKKS
jgi:hypothetical protein